jgi:hypothetical protein
MGAGVYLVWPAFYTDVSDAYRLDRRGRLRTDLGGVYFNAIAVLVAAALYAWTGFAPLAVYVVAGQLETLHQFLPFIRLDGYHLVSDLAGVPNLFAYLRPVLARLTHRRDSPAGQRARVRLAQLKPGARRLITAWVCLTAPILAVNVVVFALLGPRLAGAGWASAQAQLEALGPAARSGDLLGTVDAALSLVLLALPVAGTAYVAVRTLRQLSRATRRSWRARPAPTAALALALSAALALVVVEQGPSSFADSRHRAELAEAAARPAAPPSAPEATAEAPPPRPATAEAPPRPALAPLPTTLAPPPLVLAQATCATTAAGPAPAAPAGGQRQPWADELLCLAGVS